MKVKAQRLPSGVYWTVFIG